METLLLNALWSMFGGTPCAPEPPEPGDPAPGPGPMETDLCLTRLTYEFVADRTVCGRCGAAFGRKARLTVWRGRAGTAWRICVRTRCRGLRRHPHLAVVTEDRGGLRFGELRPR